MGSRSNKLNKADSGWVANAVSSSSFEGLNSTGSWSAMMWDSGNKVGHWVVVKGTDDLGNVIEKVNLNPSAGVYGVEIPSGTWHSIIALEPGTVIFEIKSGPYKPLPPEDIAPWAPAPSDLEGAAVFMKRMLEV